MQYFIIGDRELVIAFGLVGVQGSAVVTKEEALEAFKHATGTGSALSVPAVDERPKVLILTENVSVMIEQEVFEWQKKGEYPLIVEIPGIQGHLQGRKSLTDSIREAVGIRV